TRRAAPLPSDTQASGPSKTPTPPVWAAAATPRQTAQSLAPGSTRPPPNFARCRSWNLGDVIRTWIESDRCGEQLTAVTFADILNPMDNFGRAIATFDSTESSWTKSSKET